MEFDRTVGILAARDAGPRRLEEILRPLVAPGVVLAVPVLVRDVGQPGDGIDGDPEQLLGLKVREQINQVFQQHDGHAREGVYGESADQGGDPRSVILQVGREGKDAKMQVHQKGGETGQQGNLEQNRELH